MRKICGLTLVLALVGAPAFADAFIPGAFNGWDNTTPMTETAPGSGIYTYSIPTQTADTFQNFLLLTESGNWDAKYIPSGDQWMVTDGAGNQTITLDTNTYADGWYPEQNRVGVTSEQGSWTAVGDWQGWDNSNPATAMSSQGGGIYMYSTGVLTPGEHYFKAVKTGSWDAIGADSRSVNANNFAFTTDAVMDSANLYVDALNGVIKVELVPEPASLLLLGLAGLLIRRR